MPDERCRCTSFQVLYSERTHLLSSIFDYKGKGVIFIEAMMYRRMPLLEMF